MNLFSWLTTKFDKGAVVVDSSFIKELFKAEFGFTPTSLDRYYIVLEEKRFEELTFAKIPEYLPGYGEVTKEKGQSWPDCNFYALVAMCFVQMCAALMSFKWAPLFGFIDYWKLRTWGLTKGERVYHRANWAVVLTESGAFKIRLFQGQSREWRDNTLEVLKVGRAEF